MQTEDHAGATAGKIVNNPYVTAVDAAGSPAAERTVSSAAFRRNVQDQLPLGEGNGGDTKGREMGQEAGGRHGETPEMGCLVLPLSHHHEGGRARFGENRMI
jgi:hypothetical protein